MPISLPPRLGAILCAALSIIAGATAPAEEISPTLVAGNLWYANPATPSSSPAAAVLTLSGSAGIRLIRIGGHAFDVSQPSDSTLAAWAARIRATGAEPLIQLSQYRTAAQAAATVRALNFNLNGTPSATRVAWWSIGNEPWLQANQAEDPDPSEAAIAARVATYFKAAAAAMKAVDPAIRIFGVDSEDFQSGLHRRLFLDAGADNIAGLVPGKSYYYCDGLSWHRYPQSDASVLRPELEGLNDFRTRVINCKTMIDAANLAQDRTGANALLWGIGEFNAKNGPAVHTWGNGQMFGGVYGLALKYDATLAASWSLYESDGDRTSTDFSLFDGTARIPRPSYWHTQFVGKYFTGRYLEGNPAIDHASFDLLVYGAEDAGRGHVAVMIINRGDVARPYTLHLNASGTHSAAGATTLNIDADRADTHADTIPAHATHTLVFRRDSTIRVTYARTDFETGIAPQTTVLPRVSPGLLDGFDAYSDFAQEGYWTPLTVGAGQPSVSAGQLVLRAADSAYAATAIGGPVVPALNFFDHGFTVALDGVALSGANLAAGSTHFRLALNSGADRSYRADDSLALRISPTDVRLGFKLNQPNVQGEIRAGSGTADTFLDSFAYTGEIRSLRLALEPSTTGPAAGLYTVAYTLQLDGSFGRIVRTGVFSLPRADWGALGDSALVLESRRENAFAGGSSSYAETRLDAVSVHPRLLDDFTAYGTLADQTYWTYLSNGAASTVGFAGGNATLLARTDAFASAALGGLVSGDLNFRRRPFTLELRDLALTSANLAASEAIFRVALTSTRQRPFTAPDAIVLRLTPTRAVLGYKLNQPGVDGEFRTGSSVASASLLDFNPGGVVTGLSLTLSPLGAALPADTIFYALRLSGAFGVRAFTGTFTLDSRWGEAPADDGDAALVLECRRNNAAAGASSSLSQAVIGSVAYSPVPDDLFTEAPSLAAWRQREFATAELDLPSVSGPDAAPASDGVPNLLKYAFGLSAKTPAPAGLMPAAVLDTGGRLTLAHEERANATDLTYQVEASTDLATWTTPVLELTRSAPADGWIAVTSRANVPDASPRVFLRLRVTTP